MMMGLVVCVRKKIVWRWSICKDRIYLVDDEFRCIHGVWWRRVLHCRERCQNKRGSSRPTTEDDDGQCVCYCNNYTIAVHTMVLRLQYLLPKLLLLQW